MSQYNIIIAVVAFIACFVLGIIFKKIAEKFLRQSRAKFIGVYLQYLSIWLAIIVGLSISIPFIAEIFSTSPYANLIAVLSHIAVAILWLILFLRFLRATEEVIYKKYDLSIANNFYARQMQTRFIYIKRVLTMVAFLVTFAVILLNFDRVREVGVTLLASAGVLTAIIGFAAQQSLANILAGFQLAFTQPVRLDDVVFVEGEFGRVEEINMTYVVVNLWDKRRLVLPIKYFIEKPFQNWTRKTSDLIGSIFLYLDYSVDINALEKEVKRLVEINKLWDRKVVNVQVSDCKDHYMELRILVSAASAANLWDLRCEIRGQVIKYLAAQQPGCFPKMRNLLFEDLSNQSQII